MNFVTLFPETENVHLLKDVGMIPYILFKHCGYDSTLACYKNSSNYTFLDNEVKGLKIDFIKKITGNSTKDGLIYLIKNARKIDVLNTYHFTARSLYWIYLYKMLNPKGKAYLKLDADYRIKDYNLNGTSIKAVIKRHILKKIQLVSIETVALYNHVNKNWPIKVHYIPNGFYDSGIRNAIKYEDKENTICTVGRIGSYQKAIEILLEGFRIASSKLGDWKLKIIGPIEDTFRIYIDNFFKNNPILKERVLFTGPIFNRNELEQQYRNSKVFCLTSRWEGFPLVFLEAIKNGCYVISSDFEAAFDVTDNEKYGDLFPIDNIDDLSQCFIKSCHQAKKLEENCKKIQGYAYENFYWPTICKKIDGLLRS